MRLTRSSGILLHPTSLPGPHGSGDLGAAAYHFIDWLVVAGQRIWQMLPLGPVGLANSPYMSHSAFAGNPLLIDLGELVSRSWLQQNELSSGPDGSPFKVNYDAVAKFRLMHLRNAASHFFERSIPKDRQDYDAFCRMNKEWLDDYALFQALDDEYDHRAWTEWDPKLVHRGASALASAAADLKAEVDFHKFTQWCFARQWNSVKKYANERNIKLVGDIPIFVAHHSADVWAHPGAYSLDPDGNPKIVAGVPPDYFSKTGQRWGNPLYRWDVMEKERYRWWVERFRTTFRFFDILRIDHFRGFEAYWEIPAREKTAERGRWVKGPGAELFKTVQRKLGKLPIIAEDLGLITPEVVALREQFEFPGMKILQFAFAGDPANHFLPHQYEPNCVVYTGTHDNDTTRGWFEKASERERNFVTRYVRTDGRDIHWDLIRLAEESVADLAIVPLQDVLGLGSEGRMNFPGTTTGNWEWRFSWEQVGPEHALRMYEATALANRCPPDRLALPPYPSGKAIP